LIFAWRFWDDIIGALLKLNL